MYESTFDCDLELGKYRFDRNSNFKFVGVFHRC
jgi:hypothetical protein